MPSMAVCCYMLAAYLLLTTSWVEKLLSSDLSSVSKESLSTRPDVDALFWFRCWSETEQKQTLLISQTQPVTLSLLSSSFWNSPFDPTWPPFTILLTLACRYFSSCSVDCEYLFHKKVSPSTLAVTLCMIVRQFRGKQFRVCSSTFSFRSQYSVCMIQITH